METTQEQGPFEKSCSQKLMHFFSPHELSFLFTSMLGAAHLMAIHVIEKEPNLLYMESSARYGILQFIQLYEMTGQVIMGEVTRDDNVKFSHMPTGEDSWKTDKDFELRIAFLVKHLYNVLLKEGKIPE